MTPAGVPAPDRTPNEYGVINPPPFRVTEQGERWHGCELEWWYARDIDGPDHPPYWGASIRWRPKLPGLAKGDERVHLFASSTESRWAAIRDVLRLLRKMQDGPKHCPLCAGPISGLSSPEAWCGKLEWQVACEPCGMGFQIDWDPDLYP